MVDAPVNLQALQETYPALAPVVAKLYPHRVEGHLASSPVHDQDLSPLVIPNGLPIVGVGLRFESTASDAVGDGADEEAAVAALQATVGRVSFEAMAMPAGAASLSRDDLAAVGAVRIRSLRGPQAA